MSSLTASRIQSPNARLLALLLALAMVAVTLVATPPAPASAATCPCTIFGSQAPTGAPDPDTDAVELGYVVEKTTSTQ